MSFVNDYQVQSLSVAFYGDDSNRTIGIRFVDPSINQLSTAQTGAPYNLRLYKKSTGATQQAQWSLVSPFTYVSPANPGLDVNSTFYPGSGNVMTFFVDAAGNLVYNSIPTTVTNPFLNPGGYLLVVQRNFIDPAYVGNVYSVAASYCSYAPPGQIVPVGPDTIGNFAPVYGSFNLFAPNLAYTWEIKSYSNNTTIPLKGEITSFINSTTYEKAYNGLGQSAFISNTLYDFTAPLPFTESANPINAIEGNPFLTVPTLPYDVNLCIQRTNFPPPPWARFSLTCGTDGTEFTPEELQMRRKAEVLQYYTNKVNMQKSTKAQQWSFIAKGLASPNNSYATQTVNFTNPNTSGFPNNNRAILLPSECSNQALRASSFPTYCSDVPGKTMLLTFDPRVPLVRYKRIYTYPTVNQPATSNQVNN